MYPTAQSQCQIGPITLRNRIIFPAWNVNYANSDGTVSDKLHKFYMDIAEGGVGLVMMGNVMVAPDSIPFDATMRLYDESHVPSLARTCAAIKDAGAVAGVQLAHFGRQSSSSAAGNVLMAPSAIPCPVMSQFDPNYEVREMTLDDIAMIRAAFINTAELAAKAGADFVEIHVGHGYLLNEFLSPYSNRREDDYGGSFENRARLIVEILKGIRASLGNSVALSVRISGHEFVEGGLTPTSFADIVPLFEKAGIDMLNVSAGVYASMERIVPPRDLGQTPHVALAEEIKAFTHVPVCAVGSILDVATAEAILAAGKADLCAMGRAHMADPAILRKSFAGKEDDVRKCIHCNQCTFWTTGDPYVYCAVNPEYKKET